MGHATSRTHEPATGQSGTMGGACTGDKMSDSIPRFNQHDHVRLMQTSSIPKKHHNMRGQIQEQFTVIGYAPSGDRRIVSMCKVWLPGFGLVEVPNSSLMKDES